MYFFSRILIILAILTIGSPLYASWCSISDDPASPIEFLKDCSWDSEDVAVTVGAGSGKEGVKKLIANIAEKVIQFGALFAIGAIVFSGIRYTLSTGDDEKIKSAKNTAIYAIIGLVLLLTAYPLVDIVIYFIYSLGK
jgi:hypothetical protein